LQRRTFYIPSESEQAGQAKPFSKIDTARLKVYVDELRTELHKANRELWNRNAVYLASFPKDWNSPPDWVGDNEIAKENYQEDLASLIHDSLKTRDCKPNKKWPWTEVWGPKGKLGLNPNHELLKTLEWAQEKIEYQCLHS
jgi:hypothetical protein